MKKNLTILFLTIFAVIMLISCGGQSESNTEEMTELQEELESKASELEKYKQELKEKEEALNEFYEEKEAEEEAKRKAEEEAKRKEEEEKAKLAALVSDEERTSDEIAVKRMTPENVVRVKIPKKEVIVKINQIENKDFPMVKLFVSVTDKDGNPLELENPNLFVVEENGEEISRSEIKEIVQQSKAKDTELIPLSAVLAIDKSGSMALNADETKKLPEEEQPIYFAKNAAIEFLDKIQSYDNVEFIAFDHNIQSLGTNFSALEKISAIEASGHTALYGALFTSVKTLEDKDGIKAVILLTDGKNDVARVPEDNKLSHMPLDMGLDLAAKQSIPVFTIGLGKGVDSEVLKKIANDTHAAYFSTGNKEEISALYERIRNIINNQYIISYNTKFLTENTEVKVDLFGPNDKRTYQNPEELVQKEKEYQEKISTLDDQIEEYDKKYKQVEKKEKELNEKEVKLDEREKKLDKKEQVLEETRKELEAKREELAKKDEELKKLEEELANLDQQLDDKDKKLANLQDQLSSREDTLNSRKTELENKEKELNTLQASLNAREKQLNKLNVTLNNKETELNQKETELNTFDNSLNQREQELNSLNQELKNKEKELDEFEKQLSDKSESLDQREAELNKLKEELENLEQQLKEERDRLQKIKDQLLELLSTMGDEIDDVNP
jgi:DNA repair exonuclease SbcCD ATPase subunit